MLAGLRHIIRENIVDIAEASYLNCHVKGVHSFMLLDYPNKSIRVFYATNKHELYKNADVALEHKSDGMPMSVAFHAHRRNLTLQCIQGTLRNVSAYEWPSAYKCCQLDKYLYTSKILEDKMGFVKVAGACRMIIKDQNKLDVNEDIFLKAEEFHTIVVDQGEACAWLVFEGQEDPSYVNECYSNQKLELETDEGLYIKPTEKQTMELLSQINLF